MAFPAIFSMKDVSVYVGHDHRKFLQPFNLNLVDKPSGVTANVHSITQHMGKYWCDYFGVEPTRYIPEIEHPGRSNYVLLSPDARHPDKRAPDSFWIEAVATIQELGKTPIMIGPRDAVRTNTALNKLLQIEDLTGKDTIPQLYSLLRYADGVVTTDTAISHLSDALGTKTGTIFRQNIHHKFKPFWNPHVLLTALDVGNFIRTLDK